jgi:large subunit ribosomal protein L25
MSEYTLNVSARSVTGHKTHQLRSEGKVPAVLYGGALPTQNVQIDEREMDRLLAHGGALHLVNLVGDDMLQTRALIRDVQRHPVRRNLLHVDFVRVASDQKLRVSVPLHLIGHAPATDLGAIVLQNVDTLEVECLPDDMPASIDFDVSALADVHARVTVHDLVLPAGIKLVGDHGDEALVSVTLPRAAAHEEEEAAAAQPEIITERKKAEED